MSFQNPLQNGPSQPVSFSQTIRDSGHRSTFETGAVRDAQGGKGRMDLLPASFLRALSRFAVASSGIAPGTSVGVEVYLLGFLDDPREENLLIKAAILLLAEIEEHLNPSIRVQDYYLESFPNAVIELAKHFEKGANKYEARNWEKGIPVSRYIDSALRHYNKHLAGEIDEPHLVAAAWNVVCLGETLIWIRSGILPASLRDLPVRKSASFAGEPEDQKAIDAYAEKAKEVYGECLNEPFSDENTLTGPSVGITPGIQTTTFQPPAPEFIADGLYSVGPYSDKSCFAVVLGNEIIDCCHHDNQPDVTIAYFREGLSKTEFTPISVVTFAKKEPLPGSARFVKFVEAGGYKGSFFVFEDGRVKKRTAKIQHPISCFYHSDDWVRV